MQSPLETPTLRPLDLGRVWHALQRLAASGEAPWLHTEVARRMAQRLEIIRMKPESLVEWWGVAGGGTAHLVQAYPDAKRVVVEPTPALRQLAAQRSKAPWWALGRQSVSVEAPDGLLPQAHQLVWANMMLHAVADPPKAMALWHHALAVDGFVMFSCLGPGTLRELRPIYAAMGWGAPMAEFIDMHDLGDMLVHTGFADPVMDQETLQLSYADPAALLAELHGLGGNAAPDRFPGLRTPGWKSRLESALEGLRGSDGRLHLSFEVAYGHAFKPQPRVAKPQETSVSLAEMRALVRNRDTRY